MVGLPFGKKNTNEKGRYADEASIGVSDEIPNKELFVLRAYDVLGHVVTLTG